MQQHPLLGKNESAGERVGQQQQYHIEQKPKKIIDTGGTEHEK
jgi:hypothetical protein